MSFAAAVPLIYSSNIVFVEGKLDASMARPVLVMSVTVPHSTCPQSNPSHGRPLPRSSQDHMWNAGNLVGVQWESGSAGGSEGGAWYSRCSADTPTLRILQQHLCVKLYHPASFEFMHFKLKLL